MPVLSRLASATALAVVFVARIAARALRVVAFVLLVVIASCLPAPILGKPRFEPPGRRNQAAEVERRR